MLAAARLNDPSPPDASDTESLGAAKGSPLSLSLRRGPGVDQEPDLIMMCASTGPSRLPPPEP
jgi:hypothetical protein